MTTKQFTVHLQENEKELFKEWLLGREEDLLQQLQKIRHLQSKLEDKREDETVTTETVNEDLPVVQTQIAPVVTAPAKVASTPPVKRKPSQTGQSLSWTGKIIQVFQQLNKSLVSKEIIDWFFQNDPAVQDKSRAFVSKSVTSKLAVLEEKGVVKKEFIDKKYIYTLNKETIDSPGENNLFGSTERS